MGNMDGSDKGLYGKFRVTRTDGSSEPRGKHENCDYFVLDWTHDPFAIPAARAYADACEAKFPLLARDLRERADQAEVLRAATPPTPEERER